MFTVCVRDHMMIAHSLKGDLFGPAQRLHGATYVVDAEFRRPDVDADGIVVDIGRATETLKSILAELTYRNLDDEPSLQGLNTTTEILARVIFDRLNAAIAEGALGVTATAIESLKVTLRETPTAAASFEAPLRRHAVTGA